MKRKNEPGFKSQYCGAGTGSGAVKAEPVREDDVYMRRNLIQTLHVDDYALDARSPLPLQP